jgi:hypothetical protein
MRENRGPWYLLTGLLIGAALGIFYGWVVSPVVYTDTEPHTLRADLKDEYRALVALAYLANQDAARAQSRLALLRDPNPADALAVQAQQANAAGHPETEVRALGALAAVAGGPPAGIPTAVPLTVFPTDTLTPPPTGTPAPTPTASETPTTAASPTRTPRPGTPTITATGTLTVTRTSTPTRTPTPTITPIPSPTPTATPGTFILDSRLLACSTTFQGPLLVVRAFDNRGNGVPGVEIIINWQDNEEHFFTGLKPEFGLGYADFQMTPGITYTLRLADGSQLIPDIAAEQCDPGAGSLIWGTLELTFVQP